MVFQKFLAVRLWVYSKKILFISTTIFFGITSEGSGSKTVGVEDEVVLCSVTKNNRQLITNNYYKKLHKSCLTSVSTSFLLVAILENMISTFGYHYIYQN